MFIVWIHNESDYIGVMSQEKWDIDIQAQRGEIEQIGEDVIYTLARIKARNLARERNCTYDHIYDEI